MNDTNYLIQEISKNELNKNGINKKIKVCESVTLNQLIKAGFTNHYEPRLYFSRDLGNGISFNLTIKKNTLQLETLDVLNEAFLQPFDYQQLIMSGNVTPLALKIFDKVDKIMNELQDQNIIEGYQRGMYI